MSERILKALMQLFAIIAKADDDAVGDDESGRKIVERILTQELNQEQVQEYLGHFDSYLEQHQSKSKKKDGSKKRTSLNSVKVLRICTQINEELAQKQKIIVLIRLIEYINADNVVTEQELEFVTTVAEAFNISEEEYNLCKDFIESDTESVIDSEFWLVIDKNKEATYQNTRHIYSDGMQEEVLKVLRVVSVGIYVAKYHGKHELLMNGQPVPPNRTFIFTQGSSIRSSRVQPIYYSDVVSAFYTDEDAPRIEFKTDAIKYIFKGGNVGLHDLTFEAESGQMIGIMGGSGAGKSTLLNVLNGDYTPTNGSVTINGIDIHRNSDDIEGVIGYVSQDDLLIEELTVFQNLFYNAKLCFGNLDDNQIAKMVLKLLNSLGLYETRDLKVGSPLSKVISGGQRKRLNIALELIREPSVLFVDEPTSGLSSRDSENIMDLLKELALKGKLIFVVIHQPSSDIFKMFDKLMILDVGGYTIYNGNPVDGVIYFKQLINHVNPNESECITCGNVNPEQIFNIIEQKVVDEYGNLTDKRKVSSKQWNKYYLEKLERQLTKEDEEVEIPKSIFKIPNKLKQFRVYFIRDVMSKFTNVQYLLINLLEAPALAAILAFFLKFYNQEMDGEYSFYESENFPQFLFISVIVALFIGLTVSAEEIIKDQKILKREKFLNLSKGSYLFSKISIMFLLSAVQALLFVVVGNFILEIKGMFFAFWVVLFSTWCFANILGLNISASFNSAKVIYILIPILIIPQLLFSGVIVGFDKLHPMFSSQSDVPWVGNIMASRWAYEAMAVEQFTNNEYNRLIFPYEKGMKYSTYKKDHWRKRLITAIEECQKIIGSDANPEKLEFELTLLRNEITAELNILSGIDFEPVDQLYPDKVTPDVLNEALGFLDILFEHYRSKFKENDENKEAVLRDLQQTPEDSEALLLSLNMNTNESLESFVTNQNSLDGHYVIEDGRIVPKKNLIYIDPYESKFINAHFYAPRKMFFGDLVNTFTVNVFVLWMMTLALIITLYFDALKKCIDGIGKIGGLFGKGGRH